MTTKAIVFKKYGLDEMSKFRNIEDLRDFLNTLDNQQIESLCDWLSKWRKNGIHQFINQGPQRWNVSDVHISHIQVGDINDRVNHLLQKNDYLLDAIAQDPEICGHDEFASQGDFELKALIAQKQGNMYLLKDGIHRAIRAACDGKVEFKLVYY